MLYVVPTVWIIFRLYVIILEESISSILLSICGNLTDKLVLKGIEVSFSVLLVCKFDTRAVALAARQIIHLVGLIEKTGREILCIEDPHLFFVDKDEQDRLCQEKNGVDAII